MLGSVSCTQHWAILSPLAYSSPDTTPIPLQECIVEFQSPRPVRLIRGKSEIHGSFDKPKINLIYMTHYPQFMSFGINRNNMEQSMC